MLAGHGGKASGPEWGMVTAQGAPGWLQEPLPLPHPVLEPCGEQPRCSWGPVLYSTGLGVVGLPLLTPPEAWAGRPHAGRQQVTRGGASLQAQPAGSMGWGPRNSIQGAGPSLWPRAEPPGPIGGP